MNSNDFLRTAVLTLVPNYRTPPWTHYRRSGCLVYIFRRISWVWTSPVPRESWEIRCAISLVFYDLQFSLVVVFSVHCNFSPRRNVFFFKLQFFRLFIRHEYVAMKSWNDDGVGSVGSLEICPLNRVLPVPFDGPDPMYSAMTSPWPISSECPALGTPGILTTSQCSISASVGFLESGTSGSLTDTHITDGVLHDHSL